MGIMLRMSTMKRNKRPFLSASHENISASFASINLKATPPRATLLALPGIAFGFL